MPRTATTDRRTYWPRAGPAVPPPDFEDERNCAHCGYNLRGIDSRHACPECGSVAGLSPSDEPLPWDEAQTPWTFLTTLAQVMLYPWDFGSQVWRAGRLDERAAWRFRRINIAIAALCFAAVIVRFTFEADHPVASEIALAMSMVPILVWLNSATLHRLSFLKRENLLPPRSQRVRALTAYLSAPLALSPIQLVALVASTPAMDVGNDFAVPVAIAIHLFVLVLQFLFVLGADAELLHQIIDMPRGQARLLALAGIAYRVLSGLFYLALLPTLFIAITKHSFEG